MKELKERLQKFGLELHPEKTRLIEFGRFAAENRSKRQEKKPETCTFLGFTHICGKTRAGKFAIKRQTIKKRLHAKVKAIKAELIIRMHDPITKTGQWLKTVINGHNRYFGVPGNCQAMSDFRYLIIQRWRHTLSRRSQKGYMTWEAMQPLISRWLPQPHVYHPYPSERMGVVTLDKSRVR